MRMAASTTAMPSGRAAPKAAIDSFSRRNTAGGTSSDLNHFVEARVASGFDEDGGFDDRDAVGTRRAEGGNRLVFAPEYGGVHERIQTGETLPGGEHRRTHG